MAITIGPARNVRPIPHSAGHGDRHPGGDPHLAGADRLPTATIRVRTDPVARIGSPGGVGGIVGEVGRNLDRQRPDQGQQRKARQSKTRSIERGRRSDQDRNNRGRKSPRPGGLHPWFAGVWRLASDRL